MIHDISYDEKNFDGYHIGLIALKGALQNGALSETDDFMSKSRRNRPSRQWDRWKALDESYWNVLLVKIESL